MVEEKKEESPVFWVKEPEDAKKRTIEKGYDKRLKIDNFYRFNPSFAKDKEGNADTKNQILFVELKNRYKKNDKVFFWLPTNAEIIALTKHFSETVKMNMKNDNGGIKYKGG